MSRYANQPKVAVHRIVAVRLMKMTKSGQVCRTRYFGRALRLNKLMSRPSDLIPKRGAAWQENSKHNSAFYSTLIYRFGKCARAAYECLAKAKPGFGAIRSLPHASARADLLDLMIA